MKGKKKIKTNYLSFRADDMRAVLTMFVDKKDT